MRRLALASSLVGPISVVLLLSKVHAAYIADPPYDYTGSFRFSWSIAYAVALLVAAYGLGLPDVTNGWRQTLGLSVLASGAAAGMFSGLQLLTGDALLPRFVVFGSALVLVPWHLAIGGIVRGGRGREARRDRVVLVATEREIQRLQVEVSARPEHPWGFVGSLRSAEAVSEGDLEKPLVELVLGCAATVVVLDRAALSDASVVSQAASLHEAGLRVRTLLQFYEEWLAKLPTSELERSSLFFDIGDLHRIRYGRLKRIVDLAAGGCGMVPLAIATPVVWLANLVANRGPLFYRQERVGQGGRHFSILKFRTMVPEGGGSQATNWTSTDDSRVTPVGRLLRKSHLDELPQMLNIIRGDLSVVGPRPEQPHYVVQLSEKLPFYGMRHLVRPGLTGWAQVKYGYAGDEDDALEKLQYEFFYLRRQSLRFDFKVMGRTIRSVIGSEGRGR